MICDDDDGILEMVALVLKTKGYRVVTEIQSKRLCERIRLEKPDLLLLDLWMPALNGEEVLKLLKHNPETKHLPVVVISASRGGADIAKHSGADDFLEKPFDIHRLVTKIREYVY